mgnify:FL=1|jgi:S-adenosylmethionine/arginine decarboxylase-like enzyme|tara:strand:+ start:98 stop:502 length:405 start_codon:yes stop_codon:yes gene_type:complete
MKNNLLVHKHLIIRAESQNPIKDTKEATNWLLKFIKSINMKVLIGPYAKYCDMKGNRGLTIISVIETSHIVMHVWDEPNPALMQIDIYSCGEFDEHDICKKLSKDFDLTKIEYKYLNRETGLTNISEGILNYGK